jgi:hypothetical protein
MVRSDIAANVAASTEQLSIAVFHLLRGDRAAAMVAFSNHLLLFKTTAARSADEQSQQEVSGHFPQTITLDMAQLMWDVSELFDQVGHRHMRVYSR